MNVIDLDYPQYRKYELLKMLNEKLLHSFSNYLWNTYYVLGFVPSDTDIMVNNKDFGPAPKKLTKGFWSSFFLFPL